MGRGRVNPYLAAGLGIVMGTVGALSGPRIIEYAKSRERNKPAITQTQEIRQEKYDIPQDAQDLVDLRKMKVDKVFSGDYDKDGLEEYFILASRNGEAMVVNIEPESKKYLGSNKATGLLIKDFGRWHEIRMEDILTNGYVAINRGPEILALYSRNSDSSKVLEIYVLYGEGSPHHVSTITAEDIAVINDLDNDGNKEIIIRNPVFEYASPQAKARYQRFENQTSIFTFDKQWRFFTPENYLNEQVTQVKYKILPILGHNYATKKTELEIVSEIYSPQIFNAALLSILTDSRLNVIFDGRSVDAQSLIKELYGIENSANLLTALSSLSEIPTSIPGLLSRILINNYQVAMTYGPTATGPPGSWQDAYQSMRNPQGKTYINDMPVDIDLIRRYDPSWRPGDAIGIDVKYKILADQEARNARLREAEEIRRANQQTQDMIRRVDEGITNILRPSQPQSPSYPQQAPTPQPYPTGQDAVNRLNEDLNKAKEDVCKSLPIPGLCPP